MPRSGACLAGMPVRLVLERGEKVAGGYLGVLGCCAGPALIAVAAYASAATTERLSETQRTTPDLYVFT